MSKLKFIIPVLVLLLVPVSVMAYELKTANSVYVGEGETIEGNLFAAGNTITIDGTVNGDLICGAQTVNLNGEVKGDVICGAQTMNIKGPVGGNVRIMVANSANINSKIERNLNAFGSNINIASGADIGWDAFLAGAIADVRGRIRGNLHGAVANLIIGGEIGGDVKMRLDERKERKNSAYGEPLRITDDAKVGGNVYYTSYKQGNISDQAQIGGEVGYSLPSKADMAKNKTFRAWANIVSLFSALIIGLVLVSIWKRPLIRLTDLMAKEAAPSFGWGLAVLFATPFIIIILMLTIIGIPLALILFALWLIAVYVSKVITGVMAGRMITHKYWEKKKGSLVTSMVIGVLVIWLLCSLPVLGWVFSLFAILWALGGLLLYARNT